jgi:alpha-L-arabinofuranosidase
MQTKKGHATEYGEAEWFELMKRGWEMESLVKRHSEIMDEYDPEKHVWLIIGEWGTWHEPIEGSHWGFLHQQQTIRDALFASKSVRSLRPHHALRRIRMLLTLRSAIWTPRRDVR